LRPKDVKNKLVGVYLKELQVPTNKDMDEVYRDIYQMKKKIKEQAKQIAELQKELKASSS
jgi:predicted nuclease with TOPRIM domain